MTGTERTPLVSGSGVPGRHKGFFETTKGRVIAGAILLAIIGGTTAGVILAKRAQNKKNDDNNNNNNNNGNGNWRLPRNVEPRQESLDLVIAPEIAVMSGNVKILVEAVNDTDTVTLNAWETMDFSKVGVIEIEKGSTDGDLKEVDFDFDAKSQMLTLKHPMKKGDFAKLSFEYQLPISKSLSGGVYVAAEGMIVTDFEPTGARKAFPCFDEPEFKVPFDMKIAAPVGYTVLSNMRSDKPPKHTKVKGGYASHSFPPTPPISTYLVAFSVNKYKPVVGRSTGKNPVQVRAWGDPARLSQLSFALYVAERCVDELQKLLQIPYPLPKLDLLAVPNFESGAMENWGLITFRETAIYLDASTASAAEKQYVASIVSHEIVHQWFGNLVSPRWWDSLWLNEAFATFVAWLPVEKIFPEWKVGPLSSSSSFADLIDALGTDRLADSHPVDFPVEHPDEIAAVFDGIVYEKGSAVLRMAAESVGHDAFFAGVRAYLLKYKYRVASTRDFLEVMTEETGTNFSDLLDEYLTVKGFPVLTATVAGNDKKNNDTSFVAVVQDPFPDKNSKNTWSLDFSVRLGSRSDLKNSTTQRVTVMAPNATGAILVSQSYKYCDPKTGAGYVLINSKHTAFAVTRYDPSLLKCINRAIDPRIGVLGASDRAGRILDSATLSFEGSLKGDFADVSVADVMDSMQYIGVDAELAVWDVAAASLLRYATISSSGPAKGSDESLAPALTKWIHSAVAGASNAIGWDDTGSHETRILRGVIQKVAVVSKEPRAIRAAKAIFERVTGIHANDTTYSVFYRGASSKEPIAREVANAETRKYVYRVGIESFGTPAIDWVRRRFLAKSANSSIMDDGNKIASNATTNGTVVTSAERSDLLYALAAGAPDVAMKMIADGTIQAQDIPTALGIAAGTNNGETHKVLKTLEATFQNLTSRGVSATRVASAIAPSICTADEFTTFDNILKSVHANLAVKRAIQNAQSNIKWAESSVKILSEWLKANPIAIQGKFPLAAAPLAERDVVVNFDNNPAQEMIVKSRSRGSRRSLYTRLRKFKENDDNTDGSVEIEFTPTYTSRGRHIVPSRKH